MSEVIKHRLATGMEYITKDISCEKCNNLEPRESEYTEAEFFCKEKQEFVLHPELTTCRERSIASLMTEEEAYLNAVED